MSRSARLHFFLLPPAWSFSLPEIYFPMRFLCYQDSLRVSLVLGLGRSQQAGHRFSPLAYHRQPSRRFGKMAPLCESDCTSLWLSLPPHFLPLPSRSARKTQTCRAWKNMTARRNSLSTANPF